jgi:hypothetical protein
MREFSLRSLIVASRSNDSSSMASPSRFPFCASIDWLFLSVRSCVAGVSDRLRSGTVDGRAEEGRACAGLVTGVSVLLRSRRMDARAELERVIRAMVS